MFLLFKARIIHIFLRSFNFYHYITETKYCQIYCSFEFPHFLLKQNGLLFVGKPLAASALEF